MNTHTHIGPTRLWERKRHQPLPSLKQIYWPSWQLGKLHWKRLCFRYTPMSLLGQEQLRESVPECSVAVRRVRECRQRSWMFPREIRLAFFLRRSRRQCQYLLFNTGMCNSAWLSVVPLQLCKRFINVMLLLLVSSSIRFSACALAYVYILLFNDDCII